MKKFNFNINGTNFIFEENERGGFNFEHKGKKYTTYKDTSLKFEEEAQYLLFYCDGEYVKKVKFNWAEQYLIQSGLEAITFERNGITSIKNLIITGQEVNEHSTLVLAQQAFNSLKNQIAKLSTEKFINRELIVSVNDFNKYSNVVDERKPSTPWHNGWDEESKDWGRDLNAIL